MNVELHIDTLELDGLGPDDRHRFGAELRSELTHLFTERGVPPALMQRDTIPMLDCGTLDLRPGDQSAIIGAQVARVIYEGLCE